MMYFWFIPAFLLLLVVLWFLYSAATKRAPGRSDGRTVLDKTGDENRPDAR
jgi:hypothetical protein